jgi:hypothetical protein
VAIASLVAAGTLWVGVLAAQPPGTGLDQEEAIRLSREALGSRLKVKASLIMVQEAVATQWTDSSLGCPEKGMSYTPSVVPGFQVRLRWADQIYDLRVGQGRAIVCARTDDASRAGLTAAAARLYKMARRDLADRLKLEEKVVKVNVVRATTWPDERLGCPGLEPGPDAPRDVRGFRIDLSAAGKTYTYHTDAARVVLCEP